MAKMTKTQAKRMAMDIMKKAMKLDAWGRTTGRSHVSPSFYTKALKISDDAGKMCDQLK